MRNFAIFALKDSCKRERQAAVAEWEAATEMLAEKVENSAYLEEDVKK